MLLSGLFFSVCALALPSVARADVYDMSQSITSCYIRMTSKTNENLTLSDLTITPIGQERLLPITSLSLMTRNAVGTSWRSNYSWTQPAFTNNRVLYQVFQIANGTLVEGAGLQIVAGYSFSFEVLRTADSNTATFNGVADNYRYFVAKSGYTNLTEIFPDENGLFWMPFDVGYIVVTNTVSGQGSMAASYEVYIRRTGDLSLLISTIDSSMQRIVNDQTNTLMNTDGSSDILDGMQGQGEQIVGDVDFIQQTGQFANGTYQAIMNSSEQSTVTFPGINLMGFNIPSAQVSLVEYVPSNILELIKTGCTMVLFLAWFNGLRGMYHKIFLGEKEVEVVEE